MAKEKIVSADEAAAIIHNGDTVCISGCLGIGTPDELLIAIERRFRETNSPSKLTLVFAAAPGDARDRGLNRLAHPGLVKRAIGGHWALIPKLGELALAGRIEAYNLPLGCISQLYRNIAAHGPGVISKVGLGTFVDPRLQGGKLNEATMEDLVEVVRFDDQDWLRYKSFPINVALLRGTTADPAGNITMEREALPLDGLAMATAAKNSGGFVIVQVERIAASDSLNTREVQIPGILVDCVVVADPANHMQTYGAAYNHAFSGRQRVPMDRITPLDLNERKIIARRGAFELPPGGVVNLGIGMPEGVAAVASEEHVLKLVTLTAEPGAIGGMPQGGVNFGAALNADAVIELNQQIDFYDGGGLDLACLGMAQADEAGNVNVSRFGSHLAGAGGFINISQSSKKIVFAGTFTSGGLEIAIEGGAVRIVREGSTRKFVAKVEQITFSGTRAAETGQAVLYVTERCVLRRSTAGVELIEVAPGIDIERDILAQMDFRPLIGDVRPMDARIFGIGPMGLDQLLLGRSLASRIHYDAGRNILFANFNGIHVKTIEDIDLIRQEIERACRAAGKSVAFIENCDAFELDPAVSDAYFSMIAYLEQCYYTSASRYTTSAFLRLKLGEGLAERRLAPHIFETETEAQQFTRLQGAPATTP